ncbi:MAG: 5-methyltetrahydropteroyltriglutamate--homocysteine S-methyltransferase [Pseudomonadota bacterium]
MTRSANLGFPRIGAHRELKKAEEAYWRGDIAAADLEKTAKDLRARHWRLQKDAGVDIIPSNDFSFYDQVLDMSAALGAVPDRYGWDKKDDVGLDVYFAMARGRDDVTAMEMTKWFDTNYHYIVPEFTVDQKFSLSSRKAAEAYREAKALGIETRPVLIGPVTYLLLGKMKEARADPATLLPKLLPVYRELLYSLKQEGATMVQIDEPFLVMDLSPSQRSAYKEAFEALRDCGLDITLTTYFGALGDNLDLAVSLPVAGLHIDLVRAPEQLAPVLGALAPERRLSLGLVDGRNIWRADLSAAFVLVRKAVERLGAERLEIAPSCSLLHAPVDLDLENRLDDDLKSWLAFSKQKLGEVVTLARCLDEGREAVSSAFAESDRVRDIRARSSRIHNDRVKERAASVTESDTNRQSGFDRRARIQRDRFGLPAFPTTTIGSFPQTRDVRKARAAHKRGDMNDADYDAFLREETKSAIRWQETVGLDVLVHGEFERNDMVEYFGEQLDGFAFTKNGWVQSYGSRCVKPPIIFGDVARPAPMTVDWSVYAQKLTDKPVKGMLTGPVTILQWSFVRNDQPRSETCRQIALAIRDEVTDLETAGIGMIQIDEPAMREGLPLRKADWAAYLKWAVDCFRLSSSGVEDGTQIHTHMCYSEFGDIMPSIAALDADVISIETSRSQMELLEDFKDFNYPNEIGPGVWDIHSPRVPYTEEMVTLIEKAVKVIPAERIWVNPDCGLKTRGWPEVEASIEKMVSAAATLRESISLKQEDA